MGAGDILHWQFQHRRVNTDEQILAATDYTTATALITVRSANHQIYVQKLAISITTYSAVTWTFQDSAGTPVPFAFISIAGTAPTDNAQSGTIIFDFGPTGFPLTVGKDLDMVMSGAGAAGIVHIEAYEKTVGPIPAASTN